jgi:hypothetical protein
LYATANDHENIIERSPDPIKPITAAAGPVRIGNHKKHKRTSRGRASRIFISCVSCVSWFRLRICLGRGIPPYFFAIHLFAITAFRPLQARWRSRVRRAQIRPVLQQDRKGANWPLFQFFAGNDLGRRTPLRYCFLCASRRRQMAKRCGRTRPPDAHCEFPFLLSASAACRLPSASILACTPVTFDTIWTCQRYRLQDRRQPPRTRTLEPTTRHPP